MHQQSAMPNSPMNPYLFKRKPLSERFKRCFKCGEVKQLTSFPPHGSMKDGFLDNCNACDTPNSGVTPSRVLERRALFNKCLKDLDEMFTGLSRRQRRDMANVLKKTHWKKSRLSNS